MIEERCEITPTWDMSEEEWRELRFDGLGGSEIATLMGLNKYQSPYNLWAVKSRLAPAFEGNEATDWGHLLEPVVLQRLAQVSGLAIVSWPVFLRSKRKSFMTANLDGVVVEPSALFPAGELTVWREPTEPPDILGVAEAKTGAIVTPGSPQEWFKGGESIPIAYYVQGVWYMHTAIPTFTLYGALIGQHGLLQRTLEYDPATGQHVEDAAEVFWNRVLDNDPPPIDGSESSEEALKAIYPRHISGKTLEGGMDLAVLWEHYLTTKATFDQAEKDKKESRNKVVQLLGASEFGAIDGEIICSFKASKDRESWDGDRLKREHPEIWEQYKKVSPGSRSLREIT